MNLGEPALAGLRVLLVEDDVDARESLRLLLELGGAAVTAVGSAREALRALVQSTPDVLLSDLSMPGEDGYALIRKVRALASDPAARVPAAAVTARTSLEDRHRALTEGFQGYVPKPVDAAEVTAVVARLGGRSA
jgi:CheY-like chemotaxis protein